MPINPMQRRIKNSFLLGILVAVVIMAVVIGIILLQMKKIQEENNRLVSLQKTVYVALDDLKSGQSVTFDDFILGTVQSTVDQTQIINSDDFSFFDKEGNVIEKYNADGELIEKEMIVKVDIPAGTIVTKDMLAESEKDIANDLRVQEYHMISLPSELEEGDYIDIRWSIPQGQDYIVLAKKKVVKTTSSGIWLKLTEDEILMMNNAIVESYIVKGSKLYAVEYDEPGLQEAATPTYPVNGKVLELISYNPNIIQEAKDAINNRLYDNNLAATNQRTSYIDAAIAEPENQASMTENVQTKNQEELSKIQSAREDYLSSLGY